MVNHRILNSFRRLQTNFLLQLITCFILCAIVIGSFFIINKIIDEKNIKKHTITDKTKIINSVESIIIENNKIKLESYSFLLERNISNSSSSIFLQNIQNGKKVWMNTVNVSRPDVHEYFDCDYVSDKPGFISIIKYNKIDMNSVYEIFIDMSYEINGNKQRKIVSSNRYLYNNNIFSYNPLEFDTPDSNVKSDLLKNVFNNGLLHYYGKDLGIYIYEYKDKLYWVATKDFQFIDDNKTYIPFQLNTTQVNKLPNDMISYGYDNRDFYFNNYEIITEDTEPYRVAVRDIPEEYPIAYIRTGVYDIVKQTWIWSETFQLGHMHSK